MQETKALISAMTGEARGGSRAAAPGCGFSRGRTARSVSFSGVAMAAGNAHCMGDLTSLAAHERLPELAVIPREKPDTGAATGEKLRDSHVIAEMRAFLSCMA